MKVLIIIIKCALIQLCRCQIINTCQGTWINDDDTKPLVLLSSNNKEHLVLNEQFKMTAIGMGFVICEQSLENNGISETIDASRHFKNVINLKVPSVETSLTDLIEFNNSPLICLTNCDFLTSSHTSDVVNVVNILNVTGGNDSDLNSSIPNEIFTYHKPMNADAKIVSDGILHFESLYMKLIEEPETKIPRRRRILICLPKPNIDNSDVLQNIPTHEYEYIFELITKHCDDDTDTSDFLAVLANAPLNVESEVPTIFYQTPYDYPEFKDDYPNSINLSPSWLPYKYAFVKFMQLMNWHRVAVVSDDSEYSQVLSDSFIELFRSDEYFAIIDQKCEGANCDFTKVLENLYKAEAKIIILNIDKKYAANIVATVNNLGMRDVTWLVRDWPFTNSEMDSMSDIYLFNKFSLYDHNHEVAYCSTILEGLRIISKVFYRGEDLFKRDFVTLANNVRRPQRKSIVRISHLSYGRPLRKVADIEVTPPNVKVLDFRVKSEEVRLDIPELCLLRSHNFFKPCQYGTLLLLLGVVIMFVLLNLITLVYFNYYRSQQQYHRLH